MPNSTLSLPPKVPKNTRYTRTYVRGRAPEVHQHSGPSEVCISCFEWRPASSHRELAAFQRAPVDSDVGHGLVHIYLVACVGPENLHEFHSMLESNLEVYDASKARDA